MKLRAILALTLAFGLTACGTALNPFNWFGGDEFNETIRVEDTGAITDPRGLVTQVLSMSVERMPQGAIVRAAGLPPRQGYWAVDLVETERTANALTFEFRVAEPIRPTRTGTPVSREVVTATSLTRAELDGIRTITVVGATNRRSVRR